MLDILTDGFRDAKLKLKGKTTLTEELIDDAIASIRKSLLEADVEYGVTKEFLAQVKADALGKEVQLKAGTGGSKMRVTPQDHFVQICQHRLEELMGPVDASLALPANRPATIMMVGLQGTGKTTTTGKLAHYLKETKKRKPLLVAADIYRPAAVNQLKVLGERVGVPVFHIPETSPVTICAKAEQEAFAQGCDVIIFDTAGRLTIDDELMQELKDIKAQTKPDNIILVCDAMMGQDSVTTAKAFDEQLAISGFIITKLDGDARGGAALSIKKVTGKPIKFLGMGEDLARLEEFRPEGLASRILGMGDVVGLMEDFQRVSDEDHEQEAARMLKGQFTYQDFYKQIQMIQKMGSMKDLVAKLPMQDMIPKDANLDDRELVKVKAMIDSMTKRERQGIDTINPSRLQRIAKGSGHKPKDVQELVNKFSSMRKMMGQLGKNMGGLLGKIPGMQGLSNMGKMLKGGLPGMGGGMPGMGGLPGAGGGAMPSMADMAALMGGGAGAPKKPVDRDKQRKARKAKKKSRKKNRK